IGNVASSPFPGECESLRWTQCATCSWRPGQMSARLADGAYEACSLAKCGAGRVVVVRSSAVIAFLANCSLPANRTAAVSPLGRRVHKDHVRLGLLMSG